MRTQPGPSTLFKPVITTSRSGPLECDYNLHKSNATYFSDLDVGRLHLVFSLCRHGISVTGKELAKEMPQEKGGLSIALGGVACNFRREIKPFERFEVWTRVLAWDRKWLFVIGHFVKSGAVRPKRYMYQPWKKEAEGQKGSTKDGSAPNGGERRANETTHPAILASSIAKYVFKKGRLTIPPERVLRASQLFPPQPADYETPPVSDTPVTDGTSLDSISGATPVAAASAAEKLTPENAGEILAASLTPKMEDEMWDWQRVQDERLRGMRVAELYNGLDGLNQEFVGEDGVVLGRY